MSGGSAERGGSNRVLSPARRSDRGGLEQRRPCHAARPLSPPGRQTQTPAASSTSLARRLTCCAAPKAKLHGGLHCSSGFQVLRDPILQEKEARLLKDIARHRRRPPLLLPPAAAAAATGLRCGRGRAGSANCKAAAHQTLLASTSGSVHGSIAINHSIKGRRSWAWGLDSAMAATLVGQKRMHARYQWGSNQCKMHQC